MKKVSIIAAGCTLLGLIIMIITIVSVGGNWSTFNSTNVDYRENTYICEGDIDDIDIDITSDDIEVYRADVDKVTITYWDMLDYYEYRVEESKNKMTVSQKKLHDRINFFMIDLDTQDRTVILKVPNDYEGKLDINSTSGNIYVGDMSLTTLSLENSSGNIVVENTTSKGAVKFNNTSGHIDVKSLTADSLAAANTSGGISLSSLTIENDIDLSSTSGDIRLADIETSKDIHESTSSGIGSFEKIKANSLVSSTTSGGIYMSDVTTADAIKASCSSGGIRFDNISSGNKMSFSSTSGSVRGSIDDKESDFSIIAKATSGSNNLKNSRDGIKTLDVNTTSGNINITFNK